MRFRALLVFPLVFAAVVAVVAWSLADQAALSSFVTAQKILVRVLALAGCLYGASVFDRGDHLRRAWLWLGLGVAIILVRDLLGVAGVSSKPLMVILPLALNLVTLAGIWRLASAWQSAALELPGGRRGAILLTLIAGIAALAVAGPGIVKGLAAFRSGDAQGLVMVVSATVDIVSLCLIAPLVLTALSLRGGLFAWPFLLLAASQVCWLLYDLAWVVPLPQPSAEFPWADLFRGMAGNFLAVAGVAQRWAVRGVRGLG